MTGEGLRGNPGVEKLDSSSVSRLVAALRCIETVKPE